MNKTGIIDTIPKQDIDYQDGIDRYMIEIEHNRSDMAESQKRIERLRAETTEMLADTRQVLSKLAV